MCLFSPALWVSKMKSQQIWQWNEKGTQISNSDALLLSSKRRVWESSVDTWTSPLLARYVAFSWEPIIPKAMGLLQLSNHVVQNRHTGEQMTHWDILNKEIQIWWLSLTCPSVSFCTTRLLSCKRPIPRNRRWEREKYHNRHTQKTLLL